MCSATVGGMQYLRHTYPYGLAHSPAAGLKAARPRCVSPLLLSRSRWMGGPPRASLCFSSPAPLSATLHARPNRTLAPPPRPPPSSLLTRTTPTLAQSPALARRWRAPRDRSRAAHQREPGAPTLETCILNSRTPIIHLNTPNAISGSARTSPSESPWWSAEIRVRR